MCWEMVNPELTPGKLLGMVLREAGRSIVMAMSAHGALLDVFGRERK